MISLSRQNYCLPDHQFYATVKINCSLCCLGLLDWAFVFIFLHLALFFVSFFVRASSQQDCFVCVCSCSHFIGSAWSPRCHSVSSFLSLDVFESSWWVSDWDPWAYHYSEWILASHARWTPSRIYPLWRVDLHRSSTTTFYMINQYWCT